MGNQLWGARAVFFLFLILASICASGFIFISLQIKGSLRMKTPHSQVYM